MSDSERIAELENELQVLRESEALEVTALKAENERLREECETYQRGLARMSAKVDRIIEVLHATK